MPCARAADECPARRGRQCGSALPARPLSRGFGRSRSTRTVSVSDGSRSRRTDTPRFPAQAVPLRLAQVVSRAVPGLTSWAAFEPIGAEVMVMGDMVVTEAQVNPVMSTALENGLEVTALHNHFLGESPRVMFMHIGGSGSVEQLAGAVGKVFARIKEPGTPLPHADTDPAQTQLDTAALATILGHRGDLSGGVYKVTIGRTAQLHGHPIGS